jgi:glyoxylase-like metal-dependent hydrolase (beta-lactamase superfamily II)
MYLSEAVPPYGQAEEVAPGVRRVVARNPGLMTCHGTNTFLVETPGGTVAIDPGPEDAAHVAAVAAAAGRLAAILVTHAHHDHVGAAAALKAATGAPVWRMATPFGAAWPLDRALAEGDSAFGLTVVHTPGHAPDHICLARGDGLLFSGDHVMAWSSSIVSPPHGNMRAYFAALERLEARADRLYLPAHGPALPAPQAFVGLLRAYRQAREDEILAALGQGPQTPGALVAALYAKRDPRLRPAAERNVLAHLDKLREEGRVVEREDGWSVAP